MILLKTFFFFFYGSSETLNSIFIVLFWIFASIGALFILFWLIFHPVGRITALIIFLIVSPIVWFTTKNNITTAAEKGIYYNGPSWLGLNTVPELHKQLATLKVVKQVSQEENNHISYVTPTNHIVYSAKEKNTVYYKFDNQWYKMDKTGTMYLMKK